MGVGRGQKEKNLPLLSGPLLGSLGGAQSEEMEWKWWRWQDFPGTYKGEATRAQLNWWG